MKLKTLPIYALCLLFFSCAKSDTEKRITRDGANPSVSPRENIVAFSWIEKRQPEPVFNGSIRDIFENKNVGTFGDSILAPYQLSWSPDGRKIAAVGFAGGGKTNIFIFDPWGEEKPIMITDYQRKPNKEWVSSDGVVRFIDGQFVQHPSWSPTGELIAFSFHDIGNTSIWVVLVKDKKMEQVTQGPVDEQPCFSPDGSKIIYTTCDCVNRKEITEVTLKDRSIRTLISSPFDDQAPAWSPDGKYIAFISDRDLSYQIWIRRVSDSLEFQFTQDKEGIFRNSPPTWTPDGRYILYVKMTGGIWMKEFDPGIFKTSPGTNFEEH